MQIFAKVFERILYDLYFFAFVITIFSLNVNQVFYQPIPAYLSCFQYYMKFSGQSILKHKSNMTSQSKFLDMSNGFNKVWHKDSSLN